MLLSNVDDQVKPKLIDQAAEYEWRLRLGSKDIFHLEGFVANVMSTYAQFLLDISG